MGLRYLRRLKAASRVMSRSRAVGRVLEILENASNGSKICAFYPLDYEDRP